MEISSEHIKQLREETGVSLMKCKSALTEAEGDMEKARKLLQEQGAKAALKKADRDLNSGIVKAYIHPDHSVGVLLRLDCETDYVARNEDFIALAGDINLHIAAMNPENVETLLSQPFVKNPDLTIEKLIEEKVLKIGERIEVGAFTRYAI
jgi:elongation factor Ts